MNGTALKNKEFYDKVAGRYEQADGRRRVQAWLNEQLYCLTRTRRSFLDVGSGTGFVAKAARGMYEEVVALDVSQKMLDQIKDPGIRKVRYNGSEFPFDDNRFDVVVTFATLHHIDDHMVLFKEIHRVLKPGGVYYSDHDLNYAFYQKYRRAIEIYRSLRNAPRRFGVSREEYEEAECYHRGIDVAALKARLFSVFANWTISYHWQGIAPLGIETSNPLAAPLIRFTARKEKSNGRRL